MVHKQHVQPFLYIEKQLEKDSTDCTNCDHSEAVANSFTTLILAAAPSIPLFCTSLRLSATSLLFCKASFSRLFAAAACTFKKQQHFNTLLPVTYLNLLKYKSNTTDILYIFTHLN